MSALFCRQVQFHVTKLPGLVLTCIFEKAMGQRLCRRLWATTSSFVLTQLYPSVKLDLPVGPKRCPDGSPIFETWSFVCNTFGALSTVCTRFCEFHCATFSIHVLSRLWCCRAKRRSCLVLVVVLSRSRPSLCSLGCGSVEVNAIRAFKATFLSF